MAGKPRTKYQETLGQLRTQSLLAHTLKYAGYFKQPTDHDRVSMADLAIAITRAQKALPGSQIKLAAVGDIFNERKLTRWITGETSAARDLEFLFEGCDQTTFGGLREAYEHGPVQSRIFDVLSESVGSTAFYAAAGVTFKELCEPLQLRRMSEVVTSRLEKASNHTESPEDLLAYVTMALAFLRHYLISLHSMEQLVHHIDQGVKQLAAMERKVAIAGCGTVSYPMNTDALCNLLCETVATSARYQDRMAAVDRKSGMAGWQQVAGMISPAVVPEGRVVPFRRTS